MLTFLSSFWLLFPSVQKVDLESSKEGKKEEKNYCCFKGQLLQALKFG